VEATCGVRNKTSGGQAPITNALKETRAYPPTGCGRDNRLGECLVDAVEQQPRALVRHAHLACGCRDRAGITDAFEKLCLSGSDPRAGFKDDADSDSCHVGTVHARRCEIPLFLPRPPQAPGNTVYVPLTQDELGRITP
jgi:hypothetical protein